MEPRLGRNYVKHPFFAIGSTLQSVKSRDLDKLRPRTRSVSRQRRLPQGVDIDDFHPRIAGGLHTQFSVFEGVATLRVDTYELSGL